MEFQIRQSWGDECYAYEYFEIDENASIEDIKKKAIQVIKDDWKKTKKNYISFCIPEKCKKTIKVSQFNKDIGVIKDGIKFKTKWR